MVCESVIRLGLLVGGLVVVNMLNLSGVVILVFKLLGGWELGVGMFVGLG